MPQIEWRINEDNREETIAATPATPARHWRVSLVALVIVLGAGLGTLYASVKEPAPRATPTPTLTSFLSPTSTLAHPPPDLDLIETIDREAQALADGDFNTFISLQDQSDGLWYEARTRNFRAWGRPPYDGAPLYYFLGTQPDSLPRNHIELDTLQYRGGEYFREMRVYRHRNGQWLRVKYDLSVYSYQRVRLQTDDLFTIYYLVEDEPVIQLLRLRFETTYRQICEDFRCPVGLTNVHPIHLLIPAYIDRAEWIAQDQVVTITLPSPYISGLYTTLDPVTLHKLNDPIIQTAIDSLVPTLAQLLSGGTERWNQNGQGWLFLQAVGRWESNRLWTQPDMRRLLPPSWLANDLQLARLESLWDGQGVPINPDQVANSVIFFIEEKYGAESVGEFLKAIGPADSWAEVIANSLGVDAIEFGRQWKAWLKQVYAQGF